jgi:GT2 family glycosyltransferase
MDGGSTDGSVDVLRSFGDRVRWTSERDRGQADAINKGLRLATGEIVSWLNSDDFLEAGALAHVRRCMAAKPQAAIVYGRAWMIDGDGRRLREYPTFDLKRSDLQRKCYFCQPAVFVRRSAIERFGLLNEALDVCMDYEWWLRMSRDAPMAFCDAILASSRHYGTTKTAARRQRALIEAGYLMRHHFGKASWRWSAKWVVHRAKLDRWNWLTAIPGALRYRRRFDSGQTPSRYGERLLRSLR